MKLKKLIKEAVQEAVKDALDEILSEPNHTPIGVGGYGVPNNGFSKNEAYKPVVGTYKAPISTGDPIADLLQETRAQMVNQSGGGHRPDMSQMVQAPGLGMQSYDQPTMMEENFTRPEPGLDISQFDFVKKAASVYKASVAKDKQKFGG